MGSGSTSAVIIRRGTSRDIEAILNLLTDYGLPRSYFAPFYLNDSSYRPEHSWVVEENGQLVSHLRIYDRWMRVGQAKLHIAGIGNVITAPEARGHGYAGKLMQAILPELQREQYAYSLLWTHLPDLYGRYGWVPIEQELVRAIMPPPALGSVQAVPFQPTDLPGIMQLYEVTNAGRTGTIIRTPEYWREQPAWLHEERNDLLVAHDKTGEIAGYIRSRATQHYIEVLELGAVGNNIDTGRALLIEASQQCKGHLQGQFPPSLRTFFLPGEFETIEEHGLMGRVINFAELIHALEPVWNERIREAGVTEGALLLSTSSGRITIQATRGYIRMNPSGVIGAQSSVDEQEFAHLLFHGFDERANNLPGKQADSSFLRALFPQQDFVIWQADAF